MIHMETIESFFGWYLGFNPYGEITKAEWLTFSENRLLTVTAGKVFRDDFEIAFSIVYEPVKIPDNPKCFAVIAVCVQRVEFLALRFG